MSKKNLSLRMTWIIPNIFLYLIFIGYGSFILGQIDGIRATGQLTFSIVMLVLVLCTALFGTYRIWTWIRDGKM